MDGTTLLIILAVAFVVRLVFFLRRERRERDVLAYMQHLGPALGMIDRWAHVAADVDVPEPATVLAARMELTDIKVRAASWHVPPAMTTVHRAFVEVVNRSLSEWTVLSQESLDRTNEAARGLQVALHALEGERRGQSGGFRGTVLGAFFLGHPRHPFHEQRHKG